MRRYRFLVDRDVEKAAPHLPRKSTLTFKKLGLRDNAPDDVVGKTAYERECVILTANEQDFLAAIKEFQRHTAKRTCRELRGLVVLPSGYESQRRILIEAAEQLRFGGKPITWADVAEQNYFVKLKKRGAPEVRRLPRCPYCERVEV
jgi:hypothetical protein